MRLRRRTLLLSALGAVAAGLGVALVSGHRDWLQAQLTESFGPDIAGSEDASFFLDEFLAHKGRTAPDELQESQVYFRALPGPLSVRTHFEGRLRRELQFMFLHSTNIVQVETNGADFSYSGLYLPYENACANQLSSHSL